MKAVICVEFNNSELGITAVVDFSRSTMSVEADLTPSSYILDTNCHLIGGFTLCYWFAGSPYDGDWVFTIIGYHPSFNRPPHYPKPDRLGISWSLDGGLSTTGQAYLVITPKILMGGGLLSAHLSLGLLEALFDAYVDFLLNYKPFHFVGDAGTDVGVSFGIGLLFVIFYISVDISVYLYIEGLLFRGSVYVNFRVFGLTVHFGPDANPIHAVDFDTFYKMPATASNPPLLPQL